MQARPRLREQAQAERFKPRRGTRAQLTVGAGGWPHDPPPLRVGFTSEGDRMPTSTKGIVDVVFCLDASGSMAPCIDAVRKNLDLFLDALGDNTNRKIDCRIDFLAHSCGEDGGLVRSMSLNKSGIDLITALYGQA